MTLLVALPDEPASIDTKSGLTILFSGNTAGQMNTRIGSFPHHIALVFVPKVYLIVCCSLE